MKRNSLRPRRRPDLRPRTVPLGHVQPAKVTGFLDLAGLWDPSLAFVMGGAIVVALPAFLFARRRSAAWIGGAIELPTGARSTRRSSSAPASSALAGASAASARRRASSTSVS